MTDEFGVTPWGRDWARLAQPTSITRPNPAIPRARSLARNDCVGDLVLVAGSVTATVSLKRDYAVTLSCPPWTASEADLARTLLVDAPSGDLPDSLHSEAAKSGLAVGPGKDELASTCTCTQRAKPCVHVLAVYFELARRIDEQPHLALTLRGLDRPTDETASRIPIGRLDPASFYG